ncbi:M57 family metalloprotease [Hymenobacter sp. H14-R3]|uniref:M57 family metalloprotease n=1 Tax=Hymenobacter sp. H14-R3 TaxID=3046308 RepID=UPI0024B8CDC6|nr:M57 family metalloprotease [Hymenobacter sp. H14-R3]MDJ0366868.1 M57 family metalloprotease [Hymenobacter sp. H14-R3]
MYKFSSLLTLGAIATISLAGCQKSQDSATQPVTVSQKVNAQVKALGFGTSDLKAVEGGYVVEGDIFLSPEVLANGTNPSMLRVGADEQYRTTNLVNRLPRTLTVSISSQFTSTYVTAIDEAIRRYNAAGLQLRFMRISTTGADLPVSYSSDLGPGVLGRSGGFPTNGNPAPGFTLVPNVIGNQNSNAIATIMAHEMGHCIGFRHTDYFNRAYSCGSGTLNPNEGASDIGAIRIPGTPSAADPNSWMLACVGNNVNRPFNANDLTALNYLY